MCWLRFISIRAVWKGDLVIIFVFIGNKNKTKLFYNRVSLVRLQDMLLTFRRLYRLGIYWTVLQVLVQDLCPLSLCGVALTEVYPLSCYLLETKTKTLSPCAWFVACMTCGRTPVVCGGRATAVGEFRCRINEFWATDIDVDRSYSWGIRDSENKVTQPESTVPVLMFTRVGSNYYLCVGSNNYLCYKLAVV